MLILNAVKGLLKRIILYCYKAVVNFYTPFVSMVNNIKNNGICSAMKFSFADKLFRKSVYKLCAVALAFVCVFSALYVLNGLTVAVKVNYNGIDIGYIADESEYVEVEAGIEDSLYTEEAKECVKESSLTECVVNKNEIKTAQEIVEPVLSHTDGLTKGYGIVIDNKFVLACTSKEVLDNKLADIKNLYEQIFESDVLFVENVEVVSGYFNDNEILEEEEIKQNINEESLGLTVKTSVQEVYEELIDYEVKTIADPSKPKSYRFVKTQGVKGKNRITADVTYVNGEEVERVITSSEKVSEPQNMVIVCGTAADSVVVAGKGLALPIAKKDIIYVSAYFGDGRNHKGIDLAADKGVNILAADSGVVTAAGWNSIGSGYGYCVVISHNDGKTSTVYAHCSSIYVSVGDTVSKAQTIASVGSTGNSTGNHLHFELRIDNTPVDPARYLGL